MYSKMLLKSQILLLQVFFVVSASARFIATTKFSKENKNEYSYLPASNAQKDYIAECVCIESLAGHFNFSEEAMNKCKEGFGWHMDQDVTGLQERCRSMEGVTLEVLPSNFYQIVMLIPHPNDGDRFSVTYSILNPNSKFTEGLVIEPGTNYSTYSTVLDRDGTPLVWHRETSIQAWKVPAHRKYNVQVEFNVSSASIDGMFSWNRTGELDACFELDTTCQKSSHFIPTKKIRPGSSPSQIIENLPANRSCNVKLRGLYGMTDFHFNTPLYKVPYEDHLVEVLEEAYPDKVFNEMHTENISKDLMHTENIPDIEESDKVLDHINSRIVLDEASPEIIKASPPNFTWVDVVYLMAEEDGDKWTVHVAWPQPQVTPDKYNVTLLADNVVSVIVPGNANETELRGVFGTGFYNVSVNAILGRQVAHNSGHAQFPSRMATGTTVFWWAVAAGGTWAAAALAATLYWLRSCRARIKPSLKPKVPIGSKPLDISSVDQAGVEPLPEADAWEIKPERLTLLEVIGEGAFGVVRRGLLAPLGKEVAIKMLKESPTMDEFREFREEMELMKSVGAHRHVVSLVGCCTTRHPAIVAEYCSRGDLLNFLRCSWDVLMSKRKANYYNNNIYSSGYRNDLFRCKQPQEHSRLVVNKMYDLQGICDADLTCLDLLSFCRQIAMGMEFLALNKVVHRDLAARNILMTKDKTLKIADFGLSRDVYEENQYKQKGNGKLPVKWMALESLTRRIYTTQSDVWSFGVVVWEVVTLGGAPYAGVATARLPRLLRTGYRMPRPPNCSTQLYELMRECWETRPRDRPTFVELHARLDELLNSASVDEYLSLELDDEPPPTPRAHRYLRMILRAKRSWTRGEVYERPLKAPRNHYTTPPVTYKPPV